MTMHTEEQNSTEVTITEELLSYGFSADEVEDIMADEEYVIYTDTYDMADVAREWVEGIGSVKDALGARWDSYIDLDAIVRDFEYSGLISELEYEQEQEDIAEGREYTERFPDHDSLTDFAYELIEDGSVDADYIEKNDYIDWDKLGRDFEIEGTFMCIDNLGIVEVLK